jgi:hypothetical protein
MNDLSDATVMVFDDSAARGSAIPTPSEGMVTYLKDTDAVEKYDGSGFVAVATAPAILQVVTATDSTDRTTNSTAYADASISVSITPKSASSTLYIRWTGLGRTGFTSTSNGLSLRITDSSDATLTGAQDSLLDFTSNESFNQLTVPVFIEATVAAGSTSARTYKLRFKRSNNTCSILNATATGRMTVTEVG